jgi:hypothetical protein
VAGGTPEQLTYFTDRSVHFIPWSPVPEPGTVALLIAGSLAIAGWSTHWMFCWTTLPG